MLTFGTYEIYKNQLALLFPGVSSSVIYAISAMVVVFVVVVVVVVFVVVDV